MTVASNVLCERIEAYLDGELTAAESAAFDRHAATCAACQAELGRQIRLRARLRAGLARPSAGDDLRRRIIASLPLDRTVPPPHVMARRQWISMAVAASLGAILAGGGTMFLLRPEEGQDWQQAVLASHLRATLSGHIIDVASSDRHTVKPWFGGKTKVAPTVIDLSEQGYPLLGGRLDIPQREALPVLVYKAGPHVISVFVRAAEDHAAGLAKIDGFSILSWSAAGLSYSAVSDADGAELEAFRRAFEAARQKLP